MRVRNILAAVAAVLLLLPTSADAQIRIGPQLSWGDDTDLGIGGRVVASVGTLNTWDFIGTFDVFFPDDSPANDISYWEANGNLAYSFGLPDLPALSPYAGFGLNIAHVSVGTDSGDFDDTDLGINFFIGNQFDAGSMTPFAELRVVAEGASQVVLTGGILF